MNAHEAAISAVVAQLATAPSITEAPVLRGRRRPISESVAEQVCVYFAGSTPARGTIAGAPIDWATGVRFDCYARAGESVSGDQAALDLHARAWNRLMANPTLGGFATDLEPMAVVPSLEDEADSPLGMVSGAVLVKHRTSANTLEV